MLKIDEQKYCLLWPLKDAGHWQHETINNGIEMQESIDMNYVKIGLTEEGKQIADEMAEILKNLPTQFLIDVRDGNVVFPNQERASFLPKLLDEIIKQRLGTQP